MSNGQKKEQTQVSQVFSIGDKDFAETGVPGVTRLINPEVAKMKAGKAAAEAPAKAKLAAVPHPAPADKTAPVSAHSHSPAKTLADLGVELSLEFKMDRGEFRFSKFKPQAKSVVDPWQSEFFGKMILNLKTLEITENFHEFSGQHASFQKEAFAIEDQSFVQVVRSQSDQGLVTLLISNKSLASSQDAVRAILEKPAASDDGFKIELAS